MIMPDHHGCISEHDDDRLNELKKSDENDKDTYEETKTKLMNDMSDNRR